MEVVTPPGTTPEITPPAANAGAGDQTTPNAQPASPAASAGANEDQGKQDPTPPATPPASPDPSIEDDAEPPTRKSKLDYILERKQRKIEKLENQNQPPPPATPDPNEEDEYSPEELTKFKKMSEKIYGDKFKVVDQLTEKTERDHVDSEITTFFKNDPHADLAKEFEKTIRKYAQHPSRAEVPIDEIVWGVAGKRLISFAAEAVRKAQKEAKESGTGGSSGRKPEGTVAKGAWEMTPEEHAAKVQRVLSQQG
jgi:hypothetical protein